MRQILSLLILLLWVAAPGVASATLRVVTTIPDLADITRQVGGDRVSVEALVRGTQDPHFVDARPSYLVLLNRADLLVYVGAELETGYLPTLVQGARNSKIQEGGVGHLNASSLVSLLEKPGGQVDRSQGDLHPSGNPHFWLNPRNGLLVAREIAGRLTQLDPDGKAVYASRLAAFNSALTAKITDWEARLARLRGAKVIVYHRSWVYLTDWVGFEEVGAVEPKIGIPPSAASVATLLTRVRDRRVVAVFSESYYPSRTAALVAERLGAAYIKLPSMVGARQEVTTYVGLFDAIVEDLERALPGA